MTPLLVALARDPVPARPLARGFLLGLLTGAVYFAGTLYWLIETMTTFGGLATPLAVFAATMLVAYLSLFPAVFGLIVARLRQSMGMVAAVLFAPAVWVATELGRQYVWDGFPWELLGYSQIDVLPIVQVASLVGVYGLSGLLAMSAAAFALVALDRTRLRWAVAAAVALVIGGSVIWGQWRLSRSAPPAGDPVRVAVLQGNIAQEDKWNPALRDAITDRYIDLTREALARGATFIIWPESSTPFYFEEDLVRGGAIRRLARESGATLLIGSDQIEPVRPAGAGEEPSSRYYNAAFLVKPDGRTGAVYRKMHLVPFGEYVPLQSMLFFAGPIVGAVADFSPFSPGELPVLLPLGDRLVSTAICYEVIYGSLIRHFVREGSELLTTITNDAWYGRSSAAYQHWDQAAMRAIENGRYLARAANTGISGFVDPFGRVLAKSDLFVEALLVEDVRLLTTRTVYSRIGDLVAWLSLALTAAALLASGRMSRAPSKSPESRKQSRVI